MNKGENEETTSSRKADAALHLKTQLHLDTAVHEHCRVPIAISYFTRKAEKAKVQQEIESCKLTLANMSKAHQHFNRVAVEHYISSKLDSHGEKQMQSEEFSSTLRPAAMEHFATMKKTEPQDKKKKARFDVKDFEEYNELDDVENIQALKDNTPPANSSSSPFIQLKRTARVSALTKGECEMRHDQG